MRTHRALTALGLSLTTALFAPVSVAQPRLDGGTLPGQLTNPLQPADRCTECHAGGEDSNGHTYMPGDAWEPSLMANAARDPLFLATLTVAEQDSPGVGTACLRCHTPTAYTAGRATPGTGSALDPVLGDEDGVTCDTCHRSIVPASDPSAPLLSNGRLYFDDGTDGGVPTRHGPRSDPFTSPRHPSVGSEFITDARLCGQCHDLVHPITSRRDLQGADTGQPLPLQTTFTEWSQSDFSRGTNQRTCQQCHMPEVDGTPVPSTRLPGSPPRAGQRRHDFLGANTWGLSLLRTAFPGEMDEAFDSARERTQALLATAATLDVTVSPTATAGTMARVTVRVTNNTGHKLPTGYEDARLMWLQVAVDNEVISGEYTNDALVEDSQLRAYRFQLGRFENGHAVHSDFVARHAVVLEDTRIPPAGMIPTQLTQPVGRDYSGAPNGALHNYDETTFMVPLPATGHQATVRVTLLYKSTTKAYVEAIANANHTDNRGTTLLRLFNATGRAAPVTLATANRVITLNPAPVTDSSGCTAAPARPSKDDTRFGAVLVALVALSSMAVIRRRRRS